MTCVFVIGEIAACHDGDLGKALRLVDLAAEIGCDAAKTQWVSSAGRLCARRRAPEYLPAYRLLEFPREWFDALKARCDERGIEFMATVYLPGDEKVIAPYVKRWKLASFENGDGSLIEAMNAYGQPVYVSTGMLEFNEVVWLSCAYEHVELLHCVSAYPTPVEQINLGVLRSGLYAGLSDHTTHEWTGALAVAAGARVIEFHLRLADTLPTNADYAVARSPEAARVYVKRIRLAERILGDGEKRVMDCERPMLRYWVAP